MISSSAKNIKIENHKYHFNWQIKQTDKTVIADAEDATELIRNLKVRAFALKGVEDYVPAPPNIETVVIGGGHISPFERPEEVLNLVNKLLNS